LSNEENVLIWLYHQVFTDEIEDVTDEMLDKLITTKENLVALFCKCTDTTVCSSI
jgi:hypothetical protein